MYSAQNHSRNALNMNVLKATDYAIRVCIWRETVQLLRPTTKNA